MAKADTVVISEPKVEVVLTLSEVEAQAIVEVLAAVGGVGPSRSACDRVREALLNAGFDYTYNDDAPYGMFVPPNTSLIFEDGK